MSRTDPSGSPLETAAGAAGPQTTEAFGLLGNETRLAILLALWEAYDPTATGGIVPFSELRERVGMRDSGQFNYHLDKLDDHFVRKTDGGYTLRPAGLKLVQTVIAGAGRGGTLEPTEIDVPCHLCGATTVITYQDGWLYQLCTECDGGFGAKEDYPEGILFGEPFPVAALSNRSPEEVFSAGVFRLHQVMTMKMGGLCPRCSGVVESSVLVCEDHDASPGDVCPSCGNMSQLRIRWVCSVCKYRGGSSPSGAMMTHPQVMAFYQERGIDMGYNVNNFESSKQLLELMRDHEQELLSTDPLRVRVTVRYSGDVLRLVLNEEMNVIEVNENDG